MGYKAQTFEFPYTCKDRAEQPNSGNNRFGCKFSKFGKPNLSSFSPTQQAYPLEALVGALSWGEQGVLRSVRSLVFQ